MPRIDDTGRSCAADGRSKNPTASRLQRNALMEMRWFALCCGVVLLAGCGSEWVKPGASQQQFGEDRSACIDAAQRPSGPVFINPLTGLLGHGSYTDSRRYDACMVEHGWSRNGS